MNDLSERTNKELADLIREHVLPEIVVFSQRHHLMTEVIKRLEAADSLPEKNNDLCGLCGLPGADKIPHPCHWPGERIPDKKLVHADCEAEETRRAYEALSPQERKAIWGINP